MANVGSVVADLILNAGSFTANMTKAAALTGTSSTAMNRALQSVDRSAGMMLGSIKTFATSWVGLGTLLAGGGLVMLVRNALDTADAIGVMAERTGVGVEAIQELRFAAEQADVPLEALESGLVRLNNRMGEAAGGNQEAVALFDRLGVSVKDAEGNMRSADDVLGDIADAMNNAGSAAERQAIGQDLLGKGFAQLAPMLAQGRAGLAATREEAQRLGLVLDAQMVRQAREAGDRLQVVGGIVETNFTRVLLALTPVIISVATALAQAGPAIAAWIGRQMPDSMASADELRTRIGGLMAEIDNLDRASGSGGVTFRGVDFKGDLEAKRAELQRLMDLLPQAEASEQLIAAATSALGDASGEGADKVKALTDSLAFQLAQLNRTALGQQIHNNLLQAGVEAESEQGRAITEATTTLYLRQQALADVAATQARAQALTEATMTAQERYNAEVAEAKALFDATEISQTTYNRAVQQAADRLNGAAAAQSKAASVIASVQTPLEAYNARIMELNGLLADGSITQETYNRAVEQAQDSFEGASQGADAFRGAATDAFRAARDGAEGFNGILANLLNRLSDLAANSAFDKLFGGGGEKGIFDLDSIFKLPGGPGPVGGGGDPNLGPMFGFAHGGSFEVGGGGGTDSQLVRFMATPGERVTVTPPGMDRIKGGAGGGGVTVNQTFVINQGADAAAVAALHRTAAQIKRDAMAAMIDGQRRTAGGMI